VRDTTEAAASIAREQTFRLSSTPMCVASASGHVLQANRAFEALFGKDRVLSTLFIHAEEQCEIAAGLRRALEHESDVTLEGSCATANGTETTLSWSLRPLDRVVLGEAKEVAAVSSAGRDLARKTGEFESVLKALSNMYFRTDASGRIVAWYAGEGADVHIRAKDILGRRPQDIVPIDVAPLIASALVRTQSERTPVCVEYGLSTSSGVDQFEARFVPCMEDQVTAIIQKVTAHRRAETALRATEERLRSAQKMEAIGRLAGGVAHDFNNQLAVVLGRLQLLQRSPSLRDEDRAHLYEATEAGARAATLTRRLLAVSRRQVVGPAIFDLNDTVAEMHAMLARILGDHIEVTIELDDSIGPIRCEQTQIEQVILNLILNARDAMSEGGRLALSTRELTLDLEESRHREGALPGQYVVLAVTDTGCGMTRETMNHLFEPFFTTKDRGSAAGLGLTTVYGIVKQSGGHVVVQSRPGVGTTLEICLPLANSSSLEPALAESATMPVASAPVARERAPG
jgi:signal transduction histidine kinase